jgi:hypothetical protein
MPGLFARPATVHSGVSVAPRLNESSAAAAPYLMLITTKTVLNSNFRKPYFASAISYSSCQLLSLFQALTATHYGLTIANPALPRALTVFHMRRPSSARSILSFHSQICSLEITVHNGKAEVCLACRAVCRDSRSRPVCIDPYAYHPLLGDRDHACGVGVEVGK